MYAIEKITLVFFLVDRPAEYVYVSGVLHLHVMTRGHLVDAALVCKREEPSQLYAFVAPDAGIRRRAAGISHEKIIDDSLPKELPLIDDLVRDLQTLRHVPGNADLAAAALLPLS
jgi:hypothetical protein